jgi:drug/metabolite transporter (DMT)-like permease
MAAMSRDRGPALLVMCCVALVWSGAFAALKFGLSTLSPGAAVLLRFLPVWLVCGAYLVRHRRDFLNLVKGHPWKVVSTSLLGVAGYHLFLAFGLEGVTSAASSLIVACGSLFTYIFSVLARTERPRFVRFAGIAVALGGLFVVLRYGSGAGFDLRYLGYALVVLGAPLAWSGYTVVAKKVLNAGCDIRLLTATTFFLGGLPVFAFMDPTFFEALGSPGTLLLIGGYLGLVASLAGYFAWNWALRRSDPSQVAAFIVSIPALAHLWGYVFLGERLTWPAAVGGALVLAGVLVVNVAGRNGRPETGAKGSSP